jgi:NAD(P)-dependent dehydrogenase (short-subunit alcohol dehydrogenase family)
MGYRALRPLRCPGQHAAIDYDIDARASSADLGRIKQAMETNLFGAWRTCLALLPLLRQSSHGRIVNVSSRARRWRRWAPASRAITLRSPRSTPSRARSPTSCEPEGVLVNAISHPAGTGASRDSSTRSGGRIASARRASQCPQKPVKRDHQYVPVIELDAASAHDAEDRERPGPTPPSPPARQPLRLLPDAH